MHDFKKLIVYNEANELALGLYSLTEKFPKNELYRVVDQIRRAATSIGANVIEAKGSSSRKDFTNDFHYALKSANETKYWLELIRDSQKVDESDVSSLLDEVEQIAKILASSIITLRSKK